MKRIVLFIVLAFAVLLVDKTQAQDAHFSQFYANPLYINPALAGANVCPRVSISFRDQWPGLGGFTTETVSYDQYIDFLSGGVGVILMGDQQGSVFNKTSASLMYSLRLKLTRDIFLNLALQASVANNSLDYSGLTYGDMIDPRFGFIYNSQAKTPGDESKTFVDFSAGTVVYGENWYGGVAFAHITQPDDGFLSYNRLPFKTTIHGGMKFNISRDKRRTNAFFGAPIISPNILYHYQGGFQDLNYGLYLDWSPFVVGAWFRQALSFTNADAFIFLVGVEMNRFKIGYSYDLTVSSLSNVSGGAHEITLSMSFNCPEKRRKLKTISCPSF
ncbi:MAG: type IX secretion system membrane protein PorP/SprF [Bacteroidales bacterium]|jgi:type IX secretion system PorP/SprF family membrane protein|nr:type IX secretion system membrane protein PorP/SprF [Bacteroidales bacterium]